MATLFLLPSRAFIISHHGREQVHRAKWSIRHPKVDHEERHEVRDDKVQLASSPSSTTTISIGPGGLSVDASPDCSPLTTPETATGAPSNTHPLLVLPMNTSLGGASRGPSQERAASSIHDTSTSHASSSMTTRGGSDSASNLGHDNTRTLLEKVQALSLIPSPNQSKEHSPVSSPGSSPLHQRKHFTMATSTQKKIVPHTYFCTKQFEDPQRDSAGNFSLQEGKGQSVESSVRAKQLEDRATTQAALDDKLMSRKRRQPKPSTLREMNFWAPTSM